MYRQCKACGEIQNKFTNFRKGEYQCNQCDAAKPKPVSPYAVPDTVGYFCSTKRSVLYSPVRNAFSKKILIVLTSASDLNGLPTGYWLEELAAPYNAFQDAGFDVVLASIAGGAPPVDEGSLADMFMTSDCTRFNENVAAQSALAATAPVAFFVTAAQAGAFAAVFLPGGHGTAADFPDNADLQAVVAGVYSSGGVVSSVCHGPVGLVNVIDPSTGQPLVKGKKVTGFSNVEEEQVGKTDKVPMLLEDALKKQGGIYSVAAPWTPYAIADGRLVTGQNPQSSKAVALKVLEVLQA